MKKGYSFAEIIITVSIITIILAAVAPSITKQTKSSNLGLQTLPACLTSIAAASDGITLPISDITTVTNSNCKATLEKVQYNQDKAIEDIYYYINQGTATQAQSSLKLARAACDLGSEQACSLIIDLCVKDTTDCDLAGHVYDMDYYMDLASGTQSQGLALVINKAQYYYNANINNSFNTYVDGICTGDNTSIACIVNGS